MQTNAKNESTKGLSIRQVIRNSVAKWRLGADTYQLQSLDEIRPPPAIGDDGEPVVASTFDNSRELSGLVETALLRSKEILEMPLDPDGEPSETNARARVLQASVRTILQTQLRADANVLKRRSVTAHARMLRDLKKLQEERGRRPIVESTAEAAE